jgi:hypothetical protein
MNYKEAEGLAKAIGGEVWDSGGGICLICIPQDDGRLVVISDEAVCEYSSEEDFEKNLACKSILLH